MIQNKKLDQIDQIIVQGSLPIQIQINKKKINHDLVHTMRAIIIVIDVTTSMLSKDIQPSRLFATVKSIEQYITVLKNSTPLAKIALAVSSNQCCLFLQQFTYEISQIITKLQKIRIQQKSGCFSFQSSLYHSLLYFQDVSQYFGKEILIVQSSPLTKDQHPIEQTIDLLVRSQVTINVISMCGFTRVIQKTVERAKGKYITVNNATQFKNTVKTLAYPPHYNLNKVRIGLCKMALVRREKNKTEKVCFCHFSKPNQIYICTNCEATTCRQPPTQCPICETILVMPTDLYNHTIIE